MDWFQEFIGVIYSVTRNCWQYYNGPTYFESYFAEDSMVRDVFNLCNNLFDFTMRWGILHALVFLLILSAMAPLIFFFFPAWPIRLKALSKIFYTVCQLIAPNSNYSLKLMGKDKLEVVKQNNSLFADLNQLLNQWSVWNSVSGSPEGAGYAYFRNYIEDNKKRGHEGLLNIWVDWLRIKYNFKEAEWSTSGSRTGNNNNYNLLRSIVSLPGSFFLWVSEFPLSRRQLGELLRKFVRNSLRFVLLFSEYCWLFLENNGITHFMRRFVSWVSLQYSLFGFTVFNWDFPALSNFVSLYSNLNQCFKIMLNWHRSQVVRIWWENRASFWAPLSNDPRIHIWLAEISAPELSLWVNDGLNGINYVVGLFVYLVSVLVKCFGVNSPRVSSIAAWKFSNRNPSNRKVYSTSTLNVSGKSSGGSNTIINDLFNILDFLIRDPLTGSIRHFWWFFWASVCTLVAFIFFMNFWTVFRILTSWICLEQSRIMEVLQPLYVKTMESLLINYNFDNFNDEIPVLIANVLVYLWNRLIKCLIRWGINCWATTFNFSTWLFTNTIPIFFMFFFWLLYTRYPLVYVIFWMLLVLLLAIVHVVILYIYCFV